jgi:WD40 repeat protein
VYLSFRVHTNAIIDMIFSDDDAFLATASGDQTARIVDMTTQTTTSILGNHTASLKQVRFQPGANNHSVIATSSRDGSIQIWDLRVNGYSGEQLLLNRILFMSGNPIELLEIFSSNHQPKIFIKLTTSNADSTQVLFIQFTRMSNLTAL